MGEIRSKTCEGAGITWMEFDGSQLEPPSSERSTRLSRLFSSMMATIKSRPG